MGKSFSPSRSVYRLVKKKTGAIYEDFLKTTPKERLEAFGQEDHLRVYSVNGLQERLKENGFQNVEITTFPNKPVFGFAEETIIIAKK